MSIQDELQKVMEQELILLRLLMSNLKKEQQAIVAQDHEQISQLIDERLNLLEEFEEPSEKLIHQTIALAAMFPNYARESNVSHTRALEILDNLLDAEAIDARFLREQLIAIIREIQSQNSMTKQYLQDHVYHSREGLKHVPDRPITEKQKKIMLEVLDPPHEEFFI